MWSPEPTLVRFTHRRSIERVFRSFPENLLCFSEALQPSVQSGHTSVYDKRSGELDSHLADGDSRRAEVAPGSCITAPTGAAQGDLTD